MNNLEQILNDFGKEVTQDAKINIRFKKLANKGRNKIKDTDTLAKSINYQVKVHPNSFSFFIEMEEYGEWVDKGRKPGKAPPPDAIRSWIKSKPIRLRDLETGQFLKTTKSRIDSLAFLIGRKIKEKGIAATNFLSEPFEKAFKDLPDELIEAFGLDIEAFLETSLSELNKKYK